MDKTVLIPVTATLLVLAAVSLFALTRLPPGASIPMQWNLSGNPTWLASKVWGVWFTPVVALVVMGFVGTSVNGTAASASKEVWLLYLIGAVFVVAHIVHLWFAARHVAT